MKRHDARVRRLRDFALLAVGIPCLSVAALLTFAEIRYGSLMELYVTPRGAVYAGALALAGIACAAAYALTRPPRDTAP